jgi:hypothetical protein
MLDHKGGTVATITDVDGALRLLRTMEAKEGSHGTEIDV